MKPCLLLALAVCFALNLRAAGTTAPYILTPPAPAMPRINGADIFGVRPGSPFLYTIPATGERPMKFSAGKLPRGLKLDSVTGRITGTLKKKGEFMRLRCARKTHSACRRKKFRIVVGDQIALTPPMGWNSWNCFAGAVSEEKVKSAADAMAKSGLINHGWTYINVDDFWQNHRNPDDPTLRGEFRDAQGNIVPNLTFSRHERSGGLRSRPRVEGRFVFFTRPKDVRWMHRKLAAREQQDAAAQYYEVGF